MKSIHFHKLSSVQNLKSGPKLFRMLLTHFKLTQAVFQTDYIWLSSLDLEAQVGAKRCVTTLSLWRAQSLQETEVLGFPCKTRHILFWLEHATGVLVKRQLYMANQLTRWFTHSHIHMQMTLLVFWDMNNAINDTHTQSIFLKVTNALNDILWYQAISDHFFQGIWFTNKSSSWKILDISCHARKEGEQRQTDEGDEWSAEFQVGSASTLHIRYRNKGT